MQLSRELLSVLPKILTIQGRMIMRRLDRMFFPEIKLENVWKKSLAAPAAVKSSWECSKFCIWLWSFPKSRPMSELFQTPEIWFFIFFPFKAWLTAGSIPGLGRSARERNSYPLQYSGLENSMGSQSWTWLSDFHSLILCYNWLWYFPIYSGASQVAPVVENQPANAGDIRVLGAVSGSGRSPREQNGNLFQFSHLENPRDRGAWSATVHGVTEADMSKVT